MKATSKKISLSAFIAVLVLVYGISTSAWLYNLYEISVLPLSDLSNVSCVLEYEYPSLSFVLESYPVFQLKDDVFVYFTPPVVVHLYFYFLGAAPIEIAVKDAQVVLRSHETVKLKVAKFPPQLLVPERGVVGPLVVSIVLHPDAYSPEEFKVIYSAYVRSIMGAEAGEVDISLYLIGKASFFGFYREVGRELNLTIPAAVFFNAENARKDYEYFKSKIPYLPYTIYPVAILAPENSSFTHYTNMSIINIFNKTVAVAYTTSAFIEAWSRSGDLIARRLVGGGLGNTTLAPREVKYILVPTYFDEDLLTSLYKLYKSSGFNVTLLYQDIYTLRYDGVGFVAFYKRIHAERYPYP